MHQIPFLLLLLCAHLVRTYEYCDGHPCKFGKCVGKKCECDSGFTPRAPWSIYQDHEYWRQVTIHSGCKLVMDTHISGVCSRNATCAIGASCKNDMCTCDEPGWSVGAKGTMYQNMCTAGTMKDCQVTTTATSSSKCIRPIFVSCENATNSHSCNCEMPDEHAKPEYFGSYDSQCQLTIDGVPRSIPLSTNKLRFFFKIPGDKPCADELLPEYTCGCKEGTESCDYIVGAKCSGPPEPDCFLPIGIFCNKTIGECDCDRSQGYTSAWGSERCHGLPGAKCNKTEDCVEGSKCTGGKCSSCPGRQTIDWAAGKCALNIMDACDESNYLDCPQGTRCFEKDNRHKGDKQGRVCKCHGGYPVEYDPVLNACVTTVGGKCGHLYAGYSRNCKSGNGTVCENHMCVCDEKMGLASNYKFSTWECMVMHNHPCELGGTKCLQDKVDRGNWKCLKSKGNGDQYTCVDTSKMTTPKEDDFRDNGHRNVIASIAVIGFALAAVAFCALTY